MCPCSCLGGSGGAVRAWASAIGLLERYVELRMGATEQVEDTW